MWVSWHAVGDAWTTNEPLFVGVQYMLTNATRIFPDDPMESTLQLEGEWVEAQIHAPRRDPAVDNEPYRNVWPNEGQQLWDIRANRRPTGAQHLAPYIVWALPTDSSGKVSMRIYWAALVDTG